jgi:uncharacterized protein YndB with AHSA1/START domain
MSDKTVIRPEPLIVERHFDAPRATVFQAWTTADHIKNWFSPATFTTPDATIDCRPGGAFDVCMQAPDGQQFWNRGRFIDVVENERLSFEAGAHVDDSGAAPFAVRTYVTFADDGGGTLMSVRQEYEVYDESALAMIGGAPEGWRTTLDKLEREVARIKAG